MIIEEEINKVIRHAINTITGINEYAIRANEPGAPVPTEVPYSSVQMLTDNSVGWEESRSENYGDDIKETKTGYREISFSLNFFRTGAHDNARKVRTGLTRNSILEMFNAAGLGLNSRSEVRSIPDTLDGEGWEERAGFDVIISAVGSDEDIITAIETLSISVEYQNAGKKFIFNLEN